MRSQLAHPSSHYAIVFVSISGTWPESAFAYRRVHRVQSGTETKLYMPTTGAVFYVFGRVLRYLRSSDDAASGSLAQTLNHTDLASSQVQVSEPRQRNLAYLSWYILVSRFTESLISYNCKKWNHQNNKTVFTFRLLFRLDVHQILKLRYECCGNHNAIHGLIIIFIFITVLLWHPFITCWLDARFLVKKCHLSQR